MSRLGIGVFAFLGVLGSTTWAQVTQRVSVATNGAQGNGDCLGAWISADGRYVPFDSEATNLVPGHTIVVYGAFLRDRVNGTTELVSVATGGTDGNEGSFSGPISADGRYAFFSSLSTNLVQGDVNNRADIFVRDRVAGTTAIVSIATNGTQGDADSYISDGTSDGRYIVFDSASSTFVPGDSSHEDNVYLRDLVLGTTERIGVNPAGAAGNDFSDGGSISSDGRFVAFHSYASDLVSGDTNGRGDLFVRDRQAGTTELVSVATGGTQGDLDSGLYGQVYISADGRFVAFASDATNLVQGDSNGVQDVFVRDRQNQTTERVSIATGGAQGNDQSFVSGISADGRFVAFSSAATNLVPGDTNGTWDAFLHDRQTGVTIRTSVDSADEQGNGDSYAGPLSADGRYAGVVSRATNLVPGDSNGWNDVFIRDRSGGTGFTSLCDPGSSGVVACPCSNPPSGPGRGCDNSTATGGAVLSASGGTYLSSDSLAFTTTGETPTALSIVMQGNAAVSSGAIYGQGVRCVGGTIIRRLFIKTASAGSIRAPDFGSGDPTVSARSAAKGDVIPVGQSRWYLVYYRDPVVLGGCPTSSTFNATQTGQVTWAP